MGNFLPPPPSGAASTPPPDAVETLQTVPLPEPPTTPQERVLQKYGQKQIAQAVDQFESDLGGRGKLIEILLGLPTDDKLAATLGMLADPASDRVPLHQLCRAGGITLGDLYEATRKGVLVKPLLLALQQMADRILPIVQDVMERAAPHDQPCEACQGLGQVNRIEPDQPPEMCSVCRGKGSRKVLPELERQKFALELARLLPKKGVDTLVLGAGSVANLGSGTVGSMTSVLHTLDKLPARPRSVGSASTSPSTSPRGTAVLPSPHDASGDVDHPAAD